MTTTPYESLGHSYTTSRRTDSRIEHALHAALGAARSVLNVGAGAGSYEPDDRAVIAVEPSPVMLAQRARGAAPSVRGIAEALPFATDSFDAVLGVLTVHHWSNQDIGLLECRRVAKERVVLLTWDPASPSFWLEDYFPQLLVHDRRVFPSMDQFPETLNSVEVHALPIPFDCVDGFLGAFWRRPEAYLDSRVRSGMSSFARISRVDAGLHALRDDLESGRWHARYRELLEHEQLDVGYRIVVGTAPV